jgi:hypothetical protein
VRKRDRALEACVPQTVSDHLLVPGVGVGVHERHSDALDAVLSEDLVDLVHVFEHERSQHGTVGEDALPDRQPQVAGDEGRWRGPEEVVGVSAVAPPDLQHVPEALGGHQADDNALMLKEGVEPDRRAVQEVIRLGQVVP